MTFYQNICQDHKFYVRSIRIRISNEIFGTLIICPANEMKILSLKLFTQTALQLNSNRINVQLFSHTFLLLTGNVISKRNNHYVLKIAYCINQLFSTPSFYSIAFIVNLLNLFILIMGSNFNDAITHFEVCGIIKNTKIEISGEQTITFFFKERNLSL